MKKSKASIMIEMGGHRRRGEMIIPPYLGRDKNTWACAIIGGKQHEIIEVMGVWMTETAYDNMNEALRRYREGKDKAP